MSAADAARIAGARRQAMEDRVSRQVARERALRRSALLTHARALEGRGLRVAARQARAEARRLRR